MQSESFYKTFLQSSQGENLSLAATALLAKLNKKCRDDGPQQFGASTFHTLVKKHEVF